jgi:hypothetical protein
MSLAALLFLLTIAVLAVTLMPARARNGAALVAGSWRWRRGVGHPLPEIRAGVSCGAVARRRADRHDVSS